MLESQVRHVSPAPAEPARKAGRHRAPEADMSLFDLHFPCPVSDTLVAARCQHVTALVRTSQDHSGSRITLAVAQSMLASITLSLRRKISTAQPRATSTLVRRVSVLC